MWSLATIISVGNCCFTHAATTKNHEIRGKMSTYFCWSSLPFSAWHSLCCSFRQSNLCKRSQSSRVVYLPSIFNILWFVPARHSFPFLMLIEILFYSNFMLLILTFCSSHCIKITVLLSTQNVTCLYFFAIFWQVLQSLSMSPNVCKFWQCFQYLAMFAMSCNVALLQCLAMFALFAMFAMSCNVCNV